MTLPTNTHASANDAGSGNNNNNNNNGSSNNNNNSDEDSDMFGPPRCSPPIGYHHHRSRVPMISPKLRQREERKRILQLCAHKLERIKDSEANLRRSVCINNTYCRLTDELRREKQMRYLQNLPRTSDSGSTTELARENLFQPNMDDAKPASNNSSNMNKSSAYGDAFSSSPNGSASGGRGVICSLENQPPVRQQQMATPTGANSAPEAANSAPLSVSGSASERVNNRKRHLSSSNLVNDLEILDRELSAINAPMLLIDPEITQGAEQLEKAALSASRKRLRSNSSSEDESDRLVREALSQFYIPPQRLISAIEECPLDVVGLGMGMNVNVGGIGGIVGGCGGIGGAAGAGVEVSGGKRMKLNDHHHLNHHHHLHHHLELVDFDMNQNQKDFEVIMDALRLGTPTPPSGASSDSCGQAAMMSESASVFHNLVVTSLET
ncbi:ras guanine nucleotide exchange factor P [Drosophila rhopaloa]|uniref:Ras guanine nucleotide exchange factor P n=1 Tax=Drosophila rhopaloa TaxID=1041015 RepID=A0A6P4FAH0_DRORH|nr:ras guanine nucleotide exchange factor P [Drosophila rhopaloa]